MSIRRFAMLAVMASTLFWGIAGCTVVSSVAGPWFAKPYWSLELIAQPGVVVHMPTYHWGTFSSYLNRSGASHEPVLHGLSLGVEGDVPNAPFEIRWSDDSGGTHSESLDMQSILKGHEINEASVTIKVGAPHLEVWIMEVAGRKQGHPKRLLDTLIYSTNPDAVRSLWVAHIESTGSPRAEILTDVTFQWGPTAPTHFRRQGGTAGTVQGWARTDVIRDIPVPRDLLQVSWTNSRQVRHQESVDVHAALQGHDIYGGGILRVQLGTDHLEVWLEPPYKPFLSSEHSLTYKRVGQITKIYPQR